MWGFGSELDEIAASLALLTGKYHEIATSLALLAMTIFIQGGSAAAGRCATRNDKVGSASRNDKFGDMIRRGASS
jgi:hypothetical protein